MTNILERLYYSWEESLTFSDDSEELTLAMRILADGGEDAEKSTILSNAVSTERLHGFEEGFREAVELFLWT